jgi:Rrf2 family transcriptional regulator, nitric oxide-sensitive transcriptional repressor
MRLTTFSDYTLRTLMYLALHPDRFVTIAEVAAAYRISSNHLMKVAQHLGATGDVLTLRGPRGGLRLARSAASIRVGDVIRRTEPEMALVPCAGCVIQPGCALPSVLDRAVAAFMAVLDGHTIADLVAEPNALLPLLECDRAEQNLQSPSITQSSKRSHRPSKLRVDRA